MVNWDELVGVGRKEVSLGRTITEGDFSMIHNISWITTPGHTDWEYMRSSQLGEPLLALPCLMAICGGLVAHTGLIMAAVERKGFRIVTLLGFENCWAHSPVKVGDTIKVEVERVQAKQTSEPKRAVIKDVWKTFNQKGELVLEVSSLALVESTG